MHANCATIINLPPGKYVLGDVGFQNCNAYLVPYRNVRYHLQKWSKEARAPQNAQELFNLRHFTLQNVVERIFGVMKARYKILTYPRPFKMKSQVQVVAALCVLHNILNDFDEDADQDVDTPLSADNSARKEESAEEHVYNISGEELRSAVAKRDAIAEAMWNNFVARRQGDRIAE